MKIKTSFGPGKYFIGDPCYSLQDKYYYDLWGKVHKFKDGAYTFNGHQFVVAGTAYGDGCYLDNKNQEYFVDSGTLGIVPIKLAKKNIKPYGFYPVTVINKIIFMVENGKFDILIDDNWTHIDTTK